ncbi:MAG: hypothetical protein ACOCQR_02170 [bacterium]
MKKTLGIVLMLIWAVLGSYGAIQLAHNNSVPVFAEDYKLVHIEAGTKLWDVATEHGNPEDDPRKIIFEIRQLNNLDSVVVNYDTTLKIPN